MKSYITISNEISSNLNSEIEDYELEQVLEYVLLENSDIAFDYYESTNTLIIRCEEITDKYGDYMDSSFDIERIYFVFQLLKKKFNTTIKTLDLSEYCSGETYLEDIDFEKEKSEYLMNMEGLEKLDITNSQITTLPQLPKSLKTLCCNEGFNTENIDPKIEICFSSIRLLYLHSIKI